MATLQQTIRTGSGQLEKVTGLDSALDSGMQAPPITPLGLSVLPGTTPDQVKMQGTPNQKSNALRLAIQGQSDLGTRQRQTQSRSQATTEEGKQLSLAEQLSKTGGLGARVPTMVANLVSQAQTAGTQSPLTTNLTTDAGINTSIQRILSNPMDYASAKLLADQLGLPAPVDLPSMTAFRTALEGKIPGFAEVASAAALQGQQQALKLEDTDWQSLGFQNSQAAADLLGLTAEQLNGMNITQVVDAIHNEIYKDFQETGTWEQRANDPTLGATERAEARSHLKDLGAVGVRSATAGMDRLADDLQEAKQVEINGEFIPVSDLLDSDYVSGLAKSYLEGSKESQEDFRKNEPDLAKFFDTYKDIIGQVVQNVDAGMQNFANLQMSNSSLAKTAVGDVFSDDIMKAIFSDWGTVATRNYLGEIAGRPVFEALQGKKGLSETQLHDLHSNITSLSKSNPNIGAEIIQQWTEADLQRYGLLDRGSREFAQFQANIDTVNNLRNFDTAASSDDQVVRLTGARGVGDLINTQEQVNEMLRSGLFQSPSVDASNLNIDSLRNQYSQTKNTLPSALKDIANYQNQGALAFSRLVDYANQPKSAEYQILQPYLALGTATLSMDMAKQIAASTDLNTLGNIITKSKFGQLFNSDTQAYMIADYQTRYVAENLYPILQISGFPDPSAANPLIKHNDEIAQKFRKDLDYLGSKINEMPANVRGASNYSLGNPIELVRKWGTDFAKRSTENIKSLTDLLNRTKQYESNLETYKAGNNSAQVGPMANRYDSILGDAKSSVTTIQNMINYYKQYTNPEFMVEQYRNPAPASTTQYSAGYQPGLISSGNTSGSLQSTLSASSPGNLPGVRINTASPGSINI